MRVAEIEISLDQWKAAIDIFGHKDYIQIFLNNLEENFSYAFDTYQDGESDHERLEVDVKYRDEIMYFVEVSYKVFQDDRNNHKTKEIHLDNLNHYAYIENDNTGLVYKVNISDEVQDILDIASDRYMKNGSSHDDSFEYIHGGL